MSDDADQMDLQLLQDRSERQLVGAPRGVARRATLETEEDQDNRAGGQQLGEDHLPTVDLRQGERRHHVTHLDHAPRAGLLLERETERLVRPELLGVPAIIALGLERIEVLLDRSGRRRHESARECVRHIGLLARVEGNRALMIMSIDLIEN
jgi:hypothetical protein